MTSLELCIRSLILLLAALLLTDSPAFGQQKEIGDGIARLKQITSSLKLSDNDRAAYEDMVKQVESEAQAKLFYLSLFHLQGTWGELNTQAYIQSRAEVQKGGEQAFESEWKRVGEELAEKEKKFSPGTWQRLPAAVRALIQVSRSQVRPYYQSGRLYGLNTTIANGLFYIGLAPANVDFALFCQQLPFPQTKAGWKARSLAVELTQLEAEIVAAYRKSDPKDQPRYNDLNSTMKQATELNQAGWFEGALQKYLEVILRLGFITTVPATADKIASLRLQIESLGAQLEKNDIDQSIGQLYWQMAARALAGKDPPDDRNLRRATVIAEQVLPRYFKYVAEVK